MVFSFDLLDPTDTSIAAQFPANERVFRTTVQNYLNVEHDAGVSGGGQGYHAFQVGSNATKTGLTNPPKGMLFYSTDDVQFEINTGSPTAPAWVPTGSIPVGALVPFAGTTAPAGYLVCNGSAVSRTTYANLFSVIAATYGAGDGSTTFNLPDLRGRVVAGYDAGNASGRMPGNGISPAASNFAQGGGQSSHTMAPSEMPVHNHAATVTDPGHAHVIVNGPTTGGGGLAGGGTSNPASGTNAATTGITVSIGNAGAAAPLNVVQPTIIMNYLIKF